MSEAKRDRLKQWLASGEARLLPLTFPQRELWETSPVAVTDMAHHICCLIAVRGPITPEDCRAAVQLVVERQEALRLSFLPGKNGPVQMIRQTGEANFHVRELSAAEGAPDAIEELAREIFAEPFDLVQGPVYRLVMLRRGAEDFVLAFAIHHAVADGWTLGMFVEDLCGAYLHGKLGRREPLPAVPLSYSAWGAAERAFWTPAELAPRAAFWQSNLAGTPRLWSTREQPKSVAGAAQRWVARLPAELGGAARELARRSGATLFSTLLTAFQIALARWTGADDLVVGTPVANRGKQAVRETMGYCSGVVPLRGQIDRARPFSEALRSVYQTTIDAFAHAMPFAELVRAVGDPAAPGYNPVFEVRFALQNHPVPEIAMIGLSAKLSMRSTGTPRFDLACEITEEGEAMEVAWLFRPGLFLQAEIRDLDRLFQNVLTGACRAPQSRTAVLMA